MNKAEEILKSMPSVKDGLDDFYGRQTVLNALNEALTFCEVSRSIGKSTKPTLRIMTPKQKEDYAVPCQLCKYINSDYESKECQKCIEDDISGQYYG